MAQTDRVGVNAVEAIFVDPKFDWLFREQSISDWGIDAHVEVKIDDKPTGRLLALQIKSGKSYFKHDKGDYYVHYGKLRHLWYWQNNSLPVALVLHNPETKTTLWERIGPSNIEINEKGWSIKVPKKNVLDVSAKKELERGVSDAVAARQLLLALDYPLMREIDRAKADAYFEVDWDTQRADRPWEVRVYAKDFTGPPKLRFTIGTLAEDIGEFFAEHWPWLNFDYLGQHDTIQGMEGFLRSRLHVWTNDLAKAYIKVQDYYQGGAPQHFVEDPGIDGEYDDDEAMEENYRRNMERDD